MRASDQQWQLKMLQCNHLRWLCNWIQNITVTVINVRNIIGKVFSGWKRTEAYSLLPWEAGSVIAINPYLTTIINHYVHIHILFFINNNIFLCLGIRIEGRFGNHNKALILADSKRPKDAAGGLMISIMGQDFLSWQNASAINANSTYSSNI